MRGVQRVGSRPRHDDLLQVAGEIFDEFKGDRNKTPWLIANLAGMGDALWHIKRTDDELLTKAALRDELNDICEAAELIGNAFRKNSVLEFVNLIKPDQMTRLSDFLVLLGDYKQRARIASETLVVKAGAGRARSANNLEPPVWCATIIREAWSICRDGEYPGSTRAAALEAADRLWETSIGKRAGKVGALERWRRHFERAEECSKPQAECRAMRDYVRAELERQPSDFP